MTASRSGTSGSDQREARTVTASLDRFDLRSELERLADEPLGNDDRATITLARSGPLRLVLSRLPDGGELGSREAEGALAIVVLDGDVQVERDGETVRAEADQVVVVAGGRPWRARAAAGASLLVAAAWPEPQPRGEPSA